jgi:hypothetical protein
VQKQNISQDCKAAVKKMENEMVFHGNSGVCTPNILARKSEEGPLPYIKTGAMLEGNS